MEEVFFGGIICSVICIDSLYVLYLLRSEGELKRFEVFLESMNLNCFGDDTYILLEEECEKNVWERDIVLLGYISEYLIIDYIFESCKWCVSSQMNSECLVELY